MAATLLDVSNKCGLSTATVSRVINGSSLVREKTRARVVKAMQFLNYRPSHAARSLAKKRSETLGVIFPGIASGFFTEVLRGVDEIASEHNFHLMTAFSHGQRDERELVGLFLRDQRVDALIVLNLSLSDDVLERAVRSGTPIFLIDRPAGNDAIFAVSIDNLGGTTAAIQHLLTHGHRDIAIITGPRDSYDADQRVSAYRQTLAQAGVTGRDDLVWAGAFTEASGRVAMERWLTGHPELPDAIFASNDAMALGALTALRERGLRTPDDVALVGFDDVESARHVELTTVHVPMRQMGRAAAEAAVQQVLKRETQPSRVLPTNLVVRHSCGCKREQRKQQEHVT